MSCREPVVKVLGMVGAGLMVLVGALWTFQGLGYVGGSSMSGEKTWSVIGPVVAGLGVALVITLLGRKH